jgi:hypothetical protein
MDVILAWTPGFLDLVGTVDDGPYGWIFSGFANDSGLDGLNDTFADGLAFYSAFAQFRNPAQATPDGLLVATFQFTALQETSDTVLTILAEFGQYTHTAVYDETPGNDVHGMLGSATVMIMAPCPDATIADAWPRNGTVDARQPSTPRDPLPRQGIGSPGANGSQREPIVITLDPPAAGAMQCFSLCETVGDPLLGSNSIANVTYLGDGMYEIVLDHAIPAGAVTTIEYDGDGSHVEYTSHPANVNADSQAAPADIYSLIEYINGVAASPSPWGIYSEDVDHSGLLGPPDVLRVIDLLNGAGVYDTWLNTPLPTTDGCP